MKKVYVVHLYEIEGDYPVGHPSDWDVETFKNIAGDNIYTLDEFELAINHEELFVDESYIRFIYDAI
jgi:hypothetical protein